MDKIPYVQYPTIKDKKYLNLMPL